MGLIIYNNMKNREWLNYTGGLPTGTIIIINNEDYDIDVERHLNDLKYIAYYSQKLCDGVYDSTVLDVENYHKDIKYSSELGHKCKAEILLPEYLGGDKYNKYNDFIYGLSPEIVLIEKSYSAWWPWDLKRIWDNNQYLRDRGIKTYLGIWLESIPAPLRGMQWYWVKKISDGKVFWYDEGKALPDEV